MSCCRSCGRKASSNQNPRSPEKFKSRHPEGPRDLNRTLGDDLLSRRVTPAVPSALEGLTSVFGKGTGVSPPPLSPNPEIIPRERWAPSPPPPGTSPQAGRLSARASTPGPKALDLASLGRR